eukprot:403366637
MLGSNPLVIAFEPWLLEGTECDGLNYFLQFDFIENPFFYVDQSNHIIIIRPVDPILIGVHTLTLVGNKDGMASSINFGLNISGDINIPPGPCDNHEITIPYKMQSPQTYTLNSGENLLLIKNMVYNQSSSTCPPIEYTLVNANYEQLDPVISLYPFENQQYIRLYSNYISDQQYLIETNMLVKIIGKTPGYNISNEYEVNFIFQLDCAFESFTSPSQQITDDYLIFSGPKTFQYVQFLPLIFGERCASTISFQCQQGCSNSDMVKFDSTGQIIFESNSISDKGTFVLKMQATLQTSILQQKIIDITHTIEILCDCACTVITVDPYTVDQGTFDIQNTTKTHQLQDLIWSSYQTLSCTINIQFQDAQTLEVFSSAMLNLNEDLKTVTLILSQAWVVNDYSIMIVWSLNQVELKTVLFNLKITDQCSQAQIITQNSLANITYFSSDDSQTFYYDTIFSITPSNCALATYQVLYKSSLTKPSFAEIQLQNKGITIYTTDTNQKGQHVLILRGYYNDNIFADSQFTVTIGIGCKDTKLNASKSLSQQSYHYQILSGLLQIPFEEFTQIADDDCGPITYNLLTFTYDNANSFNTLNFDGLNRYINVETSDLTKENMTHGFYIHGSIGSPKVAEAQIKIFITYIYDCYVSEVKPNSKDIRSESIIYKIGSGEMAIHVSNFILNQDCQSYQGKYKINADNALAETLDLSQMHYSMIIINTNNKKLGFNPLHKLNITLDVQNPNETEPIQGLLEIPIKFVAVNNGPPSFVRPLPNIYVAQWTSLDYEFPDTQDGDNDETILFDIQLNQVAPFVKGQYPKFRISPTNLTLTGDYKIKVTLADDNPSQLFQKYELKIIVTKTETKIEYDTDIFITDKNLISTDFKAKIKSIDMQGKTQIQFNKEIKVPQNYWKFDDKVLQIQILDYEDSQKTDLKFTWEVIDFNSNTMTVQLTFEDPSKISASVIINLSLFRLQDRDNLKVKFLANRYFVEKSTGLFIEKDHTIKKQIPKQLKSDSATAFLMNSGSSGALSLSSMFYSTLFINLLFYLFTYR